MATNVNGTYILDPSYPFWLGLTNYNLASALTQAELDAGLVGTILLSVFPADSFNQLLTFTGSVGNTPIYGVFPEAYNSTTLASPSTDSLLTGLITLNNSATTVNTPLGWFKHPDLGATTYANAAPTFYTNASASYAGNAVAQHSITTNASIATVSYGVGKAGSELVTAVFSVDTVSGTYTALQTGADVVFSGTALTGSEGFTTDPTIHIHVGLNVIETFVAGTSVTDNVFISVFKA